MAKLQAEVAAKQNDEDAKRAAEEREAKLRIEMEFELEQERIAAAEREAQRQERIKKEEEMIRLRQAENSELEQRLEQLLPLVREANMIAAEFNRDIRFNSQLSSAMPDFGDIKSEKRVFQVRTDNREDGYYYIWDPDKFTNRVEMMRHLFNEYVESGGTVPDFSNKENDPFWDPPEPILLGKTYIQLKNLGYTLDLDETASIFTTATNVSGGVAGQLKLSYNPCDIGGDGEPDDDLLVEDPQELLNKEIFFRVEVERAANLQEDLCKDVFVTYIFKHEPEAIYRVPAATGVNRNPTFNYKKVHRIDCVTDYILDYLQNGNIVFKTYGNPLSGARLEEAKAATPVSKSPVRQAAQQSAAPASSPPKRAAEPAQAAKPTPVQAAPPTTAAESSTTKTTTVVATTAEPVGTIAVTDKKGSACCTIF